MSDIDLTEAVEAVIGVYQGAPAVSTATVTRGLTAALPHIERQVREQIAREIEDFSVDPAARLSGHSGIGVRAVQALAEHVRGAK